MIINDAHHGCVQKAAWRGHKAALEWLLLDEQGPRLLWQLQPLLGAADEPGVDANLVEHEQSTMAGFSAAAEGCDRCTLQLLVEQSGCASVREWGMMECRPR